MNDQDLQNLTPDQQRQLMMRFGGQMNTQPQGPQFMNQASANQPAIGQASQDQTRQTIQGGAMGPIGEAPQGQMAGNVYVPPAASQQLAYGLRQFGPDKLRQAGYKIGDMAGSAYDSLFGGGGE
jgi:hypothetical protein